MSYKIKRPKRKSEYSKEIAEKYNHAFSVAVAKNLIGFYEKFLTIKKKPQGETLGKNHVKLF